jgi:hypothetical protein
MLPLIDLKLTALAAPFQNPFTGEWACNGHAVALRMERLREQSEALNLNLDRFLSHQLARGFSLNHVKRPILVWFGVRFGCTILTFSDKLDRYYPDWAHEIPSYFEEGREAISDIFRPYAYWSGLNLHRIYPADSMLPFVDEDGNPRETDDGMEYVCDFGAATGWLLGPSYPDIADHIRAGGEDTWEYSIVPRVPQEILQVGDLRCVLLHSRYNLTA